METNKETILLEDLYYNVKRGTIDNFLSQNPESVKLLQRLLDKNSNSLNEKKTSNLIETEFDEYISDGIKESVNRIFNEHPNTVFCGSFGLVLNRLLKRPVHDLDVITEQNFFSPPHSESNNHSHGFFVGYRDWYASGSHRFMVGRDEVVCFKLKMPVFDDKVKHVVSVDVLYNENSPPTYKKILFAGNLINVEDPKSAISAKIKYLINDKSRDSAIKHLKDLIILKIDPSIIVKAIDESSAFGDYDSKDELDDFFNDDLPF